ncbi:MAG: ABC transporter ATP-binding protein [Clostridiaceae bacterium]
MLKLMKHLKPFIGLIIASFLLLFVQAMSDLTLPDYMSNIVNVGIQQGGVENAVPEVIRESQLNDMRIFMSSDDEEFVLGKYTLVDDASSEYEKYKDKYKILEEEPVYILKDINEEEDKLNTIMGKGFMTISGIEKMTTTGSDGKTSLNGMEIPEGMDVFQVIANMPDEQLKMMTEQVEEQLDKLDESTINQASTVLVKAEYEAIGMDSDKIQSNYILKIGFFMILLSLLSGACSIFVGFLGAKTAAGLAKNLRRGVFTKVQNFSTIEFDKFSTASLITRTTNDITQIQTTIVLIMRFAFYAPILGIGGVIKALNESVSMSWIIALAVVILLGFISTVFSIAIPKFKLIQKLVDKINLVSRENLSGMMVIRAFNTQKFEEDRFDKVNKDLTSTNLFVSRVMVGMMPFMMLIMNGVTLLIVWVGAKQIDQSAMQVGDMMAFMQYAIQIIMAFLMLSMIFIFVPRASVSAIRIDEVLKMEPSITETKNPKKLKEVVEGLIEFNNVCFKYPGAEKCTIENIDFKALPGKTTAFIGATGSGKTTLINLIPRFYDATAGEILLDGVNIKDLSLYDLRDNLGYVPQKSSLFSGTIESNLKYGSENATGEEVLKAAEIAQAMEFINEKEEKLNSDISQGASNISGGQKQRLSIARAIVKGAKVLIFDDSFSAIDFKTDAALRRSLRENLSDTTILIVAQRISTIKNADQIIVLEEGRQVGIGTHEELMENCSTYKEIALSQLSKEELA